MMRHECTNNGVIFSSRHPGRRVIHCIVEAVAAEKPVGCQCLQVATRFLRHHCQRQCAGVRSDDQIVSQSALEAQTGNAEGPVLIDLMYIPGIITGLGNAPRHSTLPTVFYLAGHCGLAGLRQQSILVTRHDQCRHEVFKH